MPTTATKAGFDLIEPIWDPSVSRRRKLERDQGNAEPGPVGGDRHSHGLERYGTTSLEIIAGNAT